MLKLLAVAAVFLFAATLSSAQSQRTPPGGDMVGSDRPVTRGDVRSEPTASPDANQRMTNSSGTSTGYENTPAFAGSSTHETGSAQQSPGTTGMQGQTPATAGRRRSQKESGANGSAGRRAHALPDRKGKGTHNGRRRKQTHGQAADASPKG